MPSCFDVFDQETKEFLSGLILENYEEHNKQCRGCKYCVIESDPDPNDWFNDDDQKALCKHFSVIDKNGCKKLIEYALRPHEKIEIPKWCPLKDD